MQEQRALESALALGRDVVRFPGEIALPPVLICLLGTFSVLKHGLPMSVRSGGRTEALLAVLGLRYDDPVPRDTVLTTVWPDSDPTLSSQALNSLVHSLNKQNTDALSRASMVLCYHGSYSLNLQAGVDVDVRYFEQYVLEGDRLANSDPDAAIERYEAAIGLYRGDLASGGDDQRGLIERERLRAKYLTLLARVAEHHRRRGDVDRALAMAQRLLTHDPCREDAHRLAMWCYVRRGERSQALRQFYLCERILQTEYEAAPEPATRMLFDEIRLNPGAI